MEKAFEIGKTSATGGFQLLIGVVTSTIILAVGAIILGRLLTSDEYGLYNIALVPSALIVLFRDWGVNSAITKYVVSLRVSHREEEIHDFIVAGLIFEVASGLALSFLSLFLASFIASAILNKPESASYIAIVSVSIISGSILAASQAGFVGFERMELSSFTIICQAIVKATAGPILIFLGYSVLGAVVGYTLGSVAAAIIGFATFYLILIRPIRRKRTTKSSLTRALRTMLHFGVPLSIDLILAGLLLQIYLFVVIPLTSNALYGNYNICTNFLVLPTFFTTPIATVLFPAFAKLDPQKERELIKNIFTASTKYASILVTPVTMVIMALSTPLVSTLYGEKYVYAPFFLVISLVGTLIFVLSGSQSSFGLLSGVGKTGMLMKQSIMTIVVGIPLGLIMIHSFGIVGLIIAYTLAVVPSTSWILYWIWKHYDAKADFQSSAKILAASAIAAAVAYSPTALLSTANWIQLIIGLALFLTVYVVGAPVIGAVTLTDITNLRVMFSGLGVLSRIIDLPLKIAEKVASTRTRYPIRKHTRNKL